MHELSFRFRRARPARAQAGFTLIEVMVVLVILGVLASLVAANVIGRADEARVVAAKQDIASVMQALKLYRLDNGATLQRQWQEGGCRLF